MAFWNTHEKEWSRVFAKWLYGKVCFAPEEKGWRYWDDKHWVKDGDAQRINRLRKQFVDDLMVYGDTSVECMFILLGPTRSGKSTTAETVQKMLNPEDDGYACACNPETFAVKKFDDASRPSSDVARLAGRRFVVTSEPPKNMLFNVARLKQLTGRDMITARFLHENEIKFYP